MERLGRRTLVLWGSGFCIAMDIVIGIMGCVELTPALATGLIVVCSLWVAAYSISLAPIGKLLSQSSWLTTRLDVHCRDLYTRPAC